MVFVLPQRYSIIIIFRLFFQLLFASIFIGIWLLNWFSRLSCLIEVSMSFVGNAFIFICWSYSSIVVVIRKHILIWSFIHKLSESWWIIWNIQFLALLFWIPVRCCIWKWRFIRKLRRLILLVFKAHVSWIINWSWKISVWKLVLSLVESTFHIHIFSSSNWDIDSVFIHLRGLWKNIAVMASLI